MKISCCRRNAAEKGSITLEAAMSLPIFIIAVMSLVFIIKVYYVHETVQQAITGACNEISVYSLIYYETNAEEVISGIEKFCSSEAGGLTGETGAAVYIRQLGKQAADYIRAQTALIPITKYLTEGYLKRNFNGDADTRLKYLNLDGGFSGMDFSESKMLADGKSIDIIVKYRLKFPFLSDIFPGIKIIQAASSCIWAGENGVPAENANEDTENIWDMNNIARGREIRKLQGANLPFNFPAVAIFENGTATSIKSINVDEEYYQKPANLKQKILTLIKKLEEFSGAESSSISIKEYQILNKELRLIIPETDLAESQRAVFDECIRIADGKGIRINVIKAYGKQSSGSEEATGEDIN